MTILKAEINDHFLIETFAKERYGYKPDRKKLLEEEEEEPSVKKFKSKPKKENQDWNTKHKNTIKINTKLIEMKLFLQKLNTKMV